MPIGKEHTMPVIPIITVSINPPNKLYSILERPKYPPFISKYAKIGKIPLNHRRNFLLGKSGYNKGANAINIAKNVISILHLSTSG